MHKQKILSTLTVMVLAIAISSSGIAKSGKSDKSDKSKKSKKNKVDPAVVIELENRLDSLQAQVDALIASQGNDPIALDVDCVNGDTIAGALASVSNLPNPVVITVSGVCNESVFISRDDVTLQGATQADGITGTFPVASQRAASRISVNNMTLVGAFAGLSCFSGSSIIGTNLIIENGARGVLAFANGSCVVDDSVIRGHSQGLTILDNSNVLLRGSVVEDNNVGANVYANASLSTDDTANNATTTIRANNIGVNLFENGSFRPVHALIENNNTIGINIAANSSMFIEFTSPTVIQNHPGTAINVTNLGSASLAPSLTMSGNGVDLACSGTVQVNHTNLAPINTVVGICN